ncbi:MAG: protein TolR [Alphaproteobacteria bacterium]
MAAFINPGPVRAHRRGYRAMSEINVTPFVDVMLVLLVIFMITAPLLTVGVPVDLPKTESSPLNEPDEPLVVTVDAEGKIYLQDTETSLESLVPKLVAITEAKPDTRIFLRGDKTIAYGKIMEVMGTVNAAGLRRVALITEMPSLALKPASRPQPKPKPKSEAQ